MNYLDLEGPLVSSVLKFIEGVHIGARALHFLTLNGLAISLAYPSGEEGGNFLIQMISACLRYRGGRGDGSSALWLRPRAATSTSSTHLKNCHQ